MQKTTFTFYTGIIYIFIENIVILLIHIQNYGQRDN
jgi:hypothetical protein